MTEEQRLQFEGWADEHGLCLDQRFFEKGNNYEDPATALAFEAWSAALQAEPK